jgi:hypothetical protein
MHSQEFPLHGSGWALVGANVRAHQVRRIAKLLAGLLATLIATPVIYVLAYDFTVFQPRLPEIRTIIEIAAPDERSSSPLVASVVRAGVAQHLSAQVSRLLLQRFELPASESQLKWHFTSALWWALVALHLTDQEQTTLFLSLSYMGNGVTGFASASQSMFDAPLNSLTLEQVATLSVIAKAPAAYGENPERLARVRAGLIQRVQNGL